MSAELIEIMNLLIGIHENSRLRSELSAELIEIMNLLIGI